ncbi:hypothetical protein SLEP1_g52465 [Rubroshorea leprosula]|uniref:Uncharacterized protein n=1 Tax=Rubroshorea leprosula TaxID=152421 RepID=A0AAV5M795_9ROSI|nr:hypothetical protein SLEP1_g52465 [Rubroshorea leprosula]
MYTQTCSQLLCLRNFCFDIYVHPNLLAAFCLSV